MKDNNIRIKFKSDNFTGTQDAVHVSDEEVQSMIDDVINKLINSLDKNDYHFCATGDTFVIGIKYGDKSTNIDLIVTQDYGYATMWKEGDEWFCQHWGTALYKLEDNNANIKCDIYYPNYDFKSMNNSHTIHRCPVCCGKGVVPNGFYRSVGDTIISSTTAPEICRSCGGKGYIEV